MSQAQVEMFVAAPGKCAQLHSLWQHTAAAQGVAILARKDAVALGEARGFNPATARTQFQVWFKRHTATLAAPVAPVRAEPPAGTEEFAAHIPQSQQDSPVANVDEAPADEPAAPVADEPVVELTKAQKKALAKAQRDAAVA